MKQVFFDGKGKLHLIDVPAPALRPGQVLVQVAYSLISTGTESTALAGGGSMIKQALRRPDLVRRALQYAARQGVRATVDLVRSASKDWIPLGYSAAGTVVEVGSGVDSFSVGDRVACAGAGFANHAEYISVPKNLCAKVPDVVAIEEAAFTTLGAIALQGVRRAEPTLGETIVVVGTGLVGLLTAQLARAHGCKVICTDLIPARLELARDLGVEHVIDANQTDVAQSVLQLTEGNGADAILLTASTSSSKPVNQAFEMCREKGRVVIVGAIGMDLERAAFYHKEIDVRISRSYGPGRYDRTFEEQGQDYPFGYVRWTETRNLSAFLDQVAAKRVSVTPLISAEYPIDKAADAYARVTQGAADTIGVLLKYSGNTEQSLPRRTLKLASKATDVRNKVGLALVGAGQFARHVHMPNLQALSKNVSVPVVVSGSGASARQAAEALGAGTATTDLRDALDQIEVNAVLIATRHDLHKEQCVAAAEAGKHIFVEKPLALTGDQCREIIHAVEKAGTLCTVGFNRRMSSLSQQLYLALKEIPGPKQLVYRVNAGPLPKNHWLRDQQVGGGRIIGEACHFFDLMTWLSGSTPVSVMAQSAGGSPDDLSAVIKFSDGSVGTLIYTSLGNAAIPKERLEVFAGGGVAILDDFRALTLAGLPGKSMKLRAQDKGTRALLANFISAIQGREELSVSAIDGLVATLCGEAALSSLAEGQAVQIHSA